ncbi:MAG: LytTR family DNA-binding domain-containing protein [Balneolaceae bacterium]|nr:LytTR family DNA-binding domain-containing protein [Balneolaceae bacterium]
MEKWTCMIVDDEPVAVRVIRRHLANMNSYEVVHATGDPLEAKRFLENQAVDLLLLDIEMPELDGLQLVKTLAEPPAVILVTAHRDYAVEGFEVNAVDYLMKPVSFPRFVRALDRFEQSRVSSNGETPDAPAPLYVTVDRKKRLIDPDEIRYVESLKDYIRIHTDRENIITKETTSDFEERLPDGRFLRIHRSFIVNVDRIRTVSHDEIELEDRILPVGRSYKERVMEKLGLD